MEDRITKVLDLLNKRFVSHPWHGVEIGEKSPEIVNAYIEIVPADAIK